MKWLQKKLEILSKHLQQSMMTIIKTDNCLTVDDIERSNFEFSENILLHAKRFLTLGLNKGDKIGILLFGNSIEYLELMYGAMYAGIIACLYKR